MHSRRMKRAHIHTHRRTQSTIHNKFPRDITPPKTLLDYIYIHIILYNII